MKENIVPPSVESLDLEFESEVFWNRWFERAGLLVGYGAYVVCFIFVFGLKWEAVKYASLFYLGLFTRISSLLIGKYYEIPNVFRNLLSDDPRIVSASREYLSLHREKAYLRLASKIYGMNDASELYRADDFQLEKLLAPKLVKPWKKAGKRYFFFIYIPIALISICIAAYF
ncbi:hypothetical protein CH379_005900 [Leptospira ellisii]|uniref:Uncharacterized protein n=1 Tax=Leptospira ellisii TaxID=2023197 RepID=A0A2N0BKB8_9LEPT|nr:hypothetical protein [Leptospira ellisii]MDV6235158.1 hypothetical protein [Leptospira ellisii]PJZ92888.1 hypothetical protein CH379_10800 [Leptospira ellisii]PKA04453.1 hypothetical protein CH375_10895 [Leptospira ellisii]